MPCREAFAAMRQKIQGNSPAPVLDKILDYMVDRGLIEDETVTRRDLMDARLMGFFMPRPSEVAKEFERLRLQDPRQASEYFYQLSRAGHYVMDERIEKKSILAGGDALWKFRDYD